MRSQRNSLKYNVHYRGKNSIVVSREDKPVLKIVNLYSAIPMPFTCSIFYYFTICVSCPVTVILLHCESFFHENKFLVCVSMPGNKAHSDSDLGVASHQHVLFQVLRNIESF